MLHYLRRYVYYEGNDADEGARRVVEAIETHDARASWYCEQQRGLIARYLPEDRQLVATYAALLDDLLARPVR